MRLRWDKADLNLFYSYTGVHFFPLLQKLDNILLGFHLKDKVDDVFYTVLDELYNEIVHILSSVQKPLSQKITKTSINSGGTRSLPYWNKPLLTPTKSGKLLASHDRVIYLTNDSPVACFTGNVLERDREQKRKDTLTICMKHYLRKTIHVSGNAGNPSSSLIVYVLKLKVV